jgi:hypothetical protein
MTLIHSIVQNNKFKFLLLASLLCFIFNKVNAQTTNTGFFMSSQYNKSAFNPAFRSEKSYLGVPVLNNFYVDLKTNLNLDRFIFPDSPKSKTFMHPDISYSQFMNGISPNNFLNADVSYTFASIGFYLGEGFWTIDLGLKVHAEANIPKNVFNFIKKGITLGDQDEIIYNLSGIQAVANAYTELGVGYSVPILDDDLLIVGAKGKILIGLARGKAYLDKLRYVVGKNQWTVDSHASMQILYPGAKIRPSYDEDGYLDKLEGFDKIRPAISGYGLGLDLGATFKPGKLAGLNSGILDKLTLSAAITDIGFISWASKNATYLATNPQTTIITGNRDISFEEGEGDSLGDIFSEVGDSLRRAMNLVEDQSHSSGEIAGIRMKLNIGAEYEVLRERLNIGILSSTYFNQSHTFSEITLAGAFRPAEFFEVGLSYSFLYSKFDTFGLAINFVPRKGMNLFLGSDYIIPHINSDFLPTSTKGLNFHLGMTIPI